jgi:hypothetical protein
MLTDTISEKSAPAFMDSRTRALFVAVRQALIIALGAIEDYLEMERSITPKHKK